MYPPLYKYRDLYVLYIPTVHAFGSLSLAHTLLVQTHIHDVSAPWFKLTQISSEGKLKSFAIKTRCNYDAKRYVAGNYTQLNLNTQCWHKNCTQLNLNTQFWHKNCTQLNLNTQCWHKNCTQLLQIHKQNSQFLSNISLKTLLWVHKSNSDFSVFLFHRL